LCDPFAAEVFVEILQIADRGDFMNFCYTLCPNQKGHSLCNGGTCPDNQRLDNCSSYYLMQKFDALLGESAFTFGVFQTFVNNVRISCPNKPEPYLHCPAVSKFEGWVQAALFNMVKRSLINMGVNCFLFSLAGMSCGIMKKMFAFIEPEVPNTENGKFTIFYDTVHISICAKYNLGNVGVQCDLCFRVMKALSDARDAHLSVARGGRESNCLLDALTTDTAFIFVTNTQSTIAILEGIYRSKGSGGTSRNVEHDEKDADDNRKEQIAAEAGLHPPEYLEHVTRQANTNRRTLYVCTIYNEAVLIDKSLANFRKHQLGDDQKASVKAITAAITKYGYYPYFGCENCKLSTLDDYIERAPKDQRGKNGHLRLVT